MNRSRRDILKLFGLLGGFPWETLRAAVASLAAADAGGIAGGGNFRKIYGNDELRGRFLLFLKNVFHLYPEEKFHRLIAEITQAQTDDAAIYREILRRLPEITPRLSALSYGLPALHKQKVEMAAETARLLDERKTIRGYVEIGTPGRYVRALSQKVDVRGDIYLVHDHKPDFGINDIAERGQVGRVGKYVPLADYAEWGNQLPEAQCDLVTNFIGLHHSPPERLDGFVKSIHRALRPGGLFLLRDHDADSESMGAMVGLAHDVFNAGLQAPWEKNRAEIRHFKSLAQIERYLASFGFAREKEILFQDGDPTKNALMRFRKT